MHSVSDLQQQSTVISVDINTSTANRKNLQYESSAAMGSVTAVTSADNNVKQEQQQEEAQQPPQQQQRSAPLFYEAFLQSVSNDIVDYLAMKHKEESQKRSTPTAPQDPKRQPGARPEGIARKRSQRKSSVS